MRFHLKLLVPLLPFAGTAAALLLALVWCVVALARYSVGPHHRSFRGTLAELKEKYYLRGSFRLHHVLKPFLDAAAAAEPAFDRTRTAASPSAAAATPAASSPPLVPFLRTAYHLNGKAEPTLVDESAAWPLRSLRMQRAPISFASEDAVAPATSRVGGRDLLSLGSEDGLAELATGQSVLYATVTFKSATYSPVDVLADEASLYWLRWSVAHALSFPLSSVAVDHVADLRTGAIIRPVRETETTTTTSSDDYHAGFNDLELSNRRQLQGGASAAPQSAFGVSVVMAIVAPAMPLDAEEEEEDADVLRHAQALLQEANAADVFEPFLAHSPVSGELTAALALNTRLQPAGQGGDAASSAGGPGASAAPIKLNSGGEAAPSKPLIAGVSQATFITSTVAATVICSLAIAGVWTVDRRRRSARRDSAAAAQELVMTRGAAEHRTILDAEQELLAQEERDEIAAQAALAAADAERRETFVFVRSLVEDAVYSAVAQAERCPSSRGVLDSDASLESNTDAEFDCAV
jgi:hypothetical protein